jgi:hypothetical protein
MLEPQPSSLSLYFSLARCLSRARSHPAACTKDGLPAAGRTTQSPVLFLARTPAKEWITSAASKLGINLRHSANRCAKMAALDSPRA